MIFLWIWLVAWRLLRLGAVMFLVYVAPQSRLEQLIVVIGAVIWHYMAATDEFSEWRQAKKAQFQTQVLRTMLPFFILHENETQGEPLAVPEDAVFPPITPAERQRLSQAAAELPKFLKDESWKRRRTPSELSELIEQEWGDNWRSYRRLDVVSLAKFGFLALEGLAIWARVWLLSVS